MLLKKASHSLKTSERKFWEFLEDVLRKMGYNPARHENNVWIKPREDVYVCIENHVDDFMLVAKDSTSCIIKIKETLNLRSEGEMDYFLVTMLEEKE